METATVELAFPKLTRAEMDLVRSMAQRQEYHDAQVVFQAGDRDIDFYVVEAGRLEIVNPTDNNKTVTIHEPGEFAGDIDLLTRRPVIVTAVARAEPTILLRVAGDDLRRLLNTVPRLSEKLLVAFEVRRELLQQAGVLGLKVIGPARSAETMLVREFLHRNFVPFTWYNSQTHQGRQLLARLGQTEEQSPIVECSDSQVLNRPSLKDLARCAGMSCRVPKQVFDLAVVGAGPAGMTAAVYAASEAISTVVLDGLGPGGQASGSSLIENFIGFPSGLSGTELATRGVLQMLKFGALLLTPVQARSLEAGPEYYTIHTDDDTDVCAHCVLVATGAQWRRLQARGAERFEGAGIYYAATTVEARVCTGQSVAVIGAGNSAGQAAMYLSECSRIVHMLIRQPELGKGMSEYLAQRIRQTERIRVHPNVEVEAVLGDEFITGLEVVSTVTGQRERIDASAVFVFTGADPHSQWLPQQVARDEQGYILTGSEAHRSRLWTLDREPCALETTLPGVLAAGDVRAGATRRVAFAVGDGAMAVTCVHHLRGLQT